MRLSLSLLAVGGGAIVQSTVIPALGVGSVVPEVPVVLVVLLGLRVGAERGCLLGFAVGLAQDVLVGGPLGLHALAKAAIGFVAGELPRWVLVSQPLVPVALAVLATVADGLARFAGLQIFQYPVPFGELFVRVILPQAGYNGVLAIVATAWPVLRLRR